MNIESIEPLQALTGETYLLDTCFIIYHAHENNFSKLKKFCKDNTCLITSFNEEELVHAEKKQKGIKHQIEHFMNQSSIKLVSINVHPGDFLAERIYSNSKDADLLQIIKDPSDAVLAAAAIQTKSTILTRDKHHIFNVKTLKELEKYGVKVLNNLPN